MLSLRRPLPFIRKSWRVLNSRSIGSCLTKTWVNLGPPPPPVFNKHPENSRVLSPDASSRRVKYDPKDALPPVVILEAAKKSGAMDISPEKAIELLLRFQELQKQSSKGWEQQLCEELEIKPEVLVLLSKILNRCPGNAQRHLARRLMLTASELGDETATISLVTSGIRNGNFRSYEKPLKQIGTMAKEGNRRAMGILGRLALGKEKNSEALDWFQKATAGPQGLDFENAGEILVYEGQLLMKTNVKKAEAVFRKAALELDDPSAYFYLSQLEEDGSPNEVVYLLKAASSGIIEAAHRLACIEYSKSMAPDGNSPPNYAMAREWFQLAGNGGYGPSMLQMAQLCRDSGESDEGLKWLQKAKKLEDVREQALEVEDSWEQAA